MNKCIGLVVVSLLVVGCSVGARETESQARINRALADTLEARGGGQGSPVIQQIDVPGGKMIVVAFANGDHQAWVVDVEGNLKGAGYKDGSRSYRLIPGGYTETH